MRSRFWTIAALIAALLLGGTGSAFAQSDCPNADSNAGLDAPALEAAIECLIAQDRAAAGVGALTPEEHLRAAARDHAADMINRHYFSVDSPTGESPKARAERFGYGDGALGVQSGALIAFGGGPTATPRAIFDSMRSNASQLAVVRNPDLREIAAGVVRGAPTDAGSDPATYAVYLGARTQAIGPVLGKSVAAEVRSGNVAFALPGGSAVPLQGVAAVPFGARVDTRQGVVGLAAASAANGTQEAAFNGGMFTLATTKGAVPVTELRLTQPRKCKGKRRLWADGAGQFRTAGKYGIAIGTGARWLTEDTCAGTRVTVNRGSVKVRNKRTGKTRTVAAGHALLLRPKR